MKYNEHFKKNIILSLLLVFAFMSTLGGMNFLFTGKAQAQEVKTQYEEQVDELAESVSFSTDITNLYNPGTPTTVYNFVVVARFLGEAESLNDIVDGQTYTFIEALEEMFNSQTNYSVNKYYKAVSNNLLDLQTVFVTDTNSLEISKARSAYGKATINDGVGYDPDNVILGMLPEQYALEYELIGEIFDHAITTTIEPSYPQTADSNGDDLIDSVSIVYLPDPNLGTASEVNVDWSDLLWPHQGQTQIDMIEAYAPMAPMLGYDISLSYYQYTYSGATYSAFNYNMSHFEEDDINARSGLPNNNTMIHELGHSLGWPDYYAYDSMFTGTESESAVRSVFAWDIMSYSHLQSAQYPTTYSRSIQNWVSDGYGIEEITANGNYTLKPVNYEEATGTAFAGRTIAYKIVNPDNANQSVWFEYRKQDTSTFDGNTIMEDGLIVYRVDEGFDTVDLMGGLKNAGNFAAAPYNVYVFRNDISGYSVTSEVYDAALNLENHSMGDGSFFMANGRTHTAADITWQNYAGDVTTHQEDIDSADVTYTDSGIAVEVVAIDPVTNELTFNINWATFPDSSGDLLERSSFGDNDLYNELLTLAGKLLTDDLYSDDLQDVISLDFNNKDFSSIQGLDLLNFNSLQRINLNFNNLSSITDLQAVMSANTSAIISLIGNSFDLDNLSSTNQPLLQNVNLIWGMQSNLYPQTKYLINNLSLQREFYYQSSYDAYFDFTLNGVDLTASNSLQWLNFDSYGQYEFDYVATLSGGFTQRASEGVINVYIIGAQTPSTQVERNDAFPDVTVLGIDASELDITRNPATPIDTSATASGIFVSWTVSVIAEPGVSQVISATYSVVDTQAPVITLTETSTIEMAPEDFLADYLPAQEILEITDNGEVVNYVFIEVPDQADRSYWTKDYYYVDASSQGRVNQIDGQSYGEYYINYRAVDAEGNNSSNYTRSVLIVAPEVALDNFADDALYDAILELTPGYTKVYENSLEGLSYVDLSNKGITSLAGMESLTYANDAYIDLSQNMISDLTTINSLILDANISKINLMLNNFNPYMVNTPPNSKYILGLQGITKDIYLNGMLDPVFGETYALYFHNYNDYAADFEISVSPSYEVVSGDNFIYEYGEYTITINSIGSFASESKTVKFGDITISNAALEVDVFEDFVLSNEITYNGLTSDDVVMEYVLGSSNIIDPETYNFTDLVGTSVMTMNYYINGVNVRSSVVTISVLDQIAPTLSLNGETTIYLMIGDTFNDEGYVADDNYLLEIVNQTGAVDTETAGVYTITYQAADTSQNTSEELSRTVYVGNIAPVSNFIVDVKQVVDEIQMFNFEAYSSDDFNIDVVSSYNQNVVGEYEVELTLTHKQEESFVVNVSNTINVMDREKPTITLIGDSSIYMYVGDAYIESGALVEDNYDEPKSVGSSSNTLDVGKVGTYALLYTAMDAQNNEAVSIQRIVHVLSKPFDNLDVKLESNTESLVLGNVVIFSVDTSGYNLNYYDFNTTFVWYVDGEEVQRDENIYLRTTFNKIGTHQVEVKAVNTVIDSINNSTYTELSATGDVLSFSIEEGNFIDRYGPAMIGGASLSIVISIIYSFISRRRRKFYF